MAAVDISLNEVTGAAPAESLVMQIGTPITNFDLGLPNDVTEIQARLFPTSHKSESAFGFPTVFASPYLSPLSVVSIGVFGEPNVFIPAPVPATLSAISPTPGVTLSSGTPWQATITPALAELLIWVGYSDVNVVEMAYDGSGFCPNFSGASTYEQLDANHVRVTLRRGGGWPSDPKIFVRARTANGGINT